MAEVRARWLALSLRERRVIIFAAPLALVLLLVIAWSVTSRPTPPAASVSVSAPVPVSAPAVVPALTVIPPPLVTAAPPGGVMLFGVSGGGPAGRAAILGSPTGGQRVVAVGRDYRPGMSVKEVGLDYAVLSGPGGDVRLELDRSGAPPVAEAGPAAPATPTLPQ